MKSTFKRNLLVGFGLSMLLLILSSIASYKSISNLLTSVDEVQRTSHVIQNLQNTLSTLKDAETGQRGFLLTGVDAFLEPYTGAYNRATEVLNEAKHLTINDAIQQQNCTRLNDIIVKRLQQLDRLIALKREGKVIGPDELTKGKQYMDEARLVVKNMVDREETQLTERTDKMRKFAGNTPLFIIVAALLSLIITLVFFVRINNDFKRRSQLQQELQEKDEAITKRINIIQNIAGKISEGDYSTRVEDDSKDGLGGLSVSLNKMAASLDYSFGLLSEKEWLQTGVAELNTAMIGEEDFNVLSAKIVDFVAAYTQSAVGVLYLKEGDALHFANGFAFDKTASKPIINVGEGIMGQAAFNAKTLLLDNVGEADIMVSYATGKAKPASIIAVPVSFENQVVGVLELATLHQYQQKHIAYLETIAPAIGIVINTSNNRKKLQELLEETQAQSEELQAQHSELENVNTELEAQAAKLQASEEELRVQQEELMHTNAEMEEKARLLEEKNQLIVERNLEIQQKAEQLAISTKYKSEFLANMSHELRTPLNSILLLSRLMSENTEENLSEQQVEYASVIQNSGQGLLALINEILDLSKIEAGKMELEIGDVYVHDVVMQLKSMFMPMADEKGIGFGIVLKEDVPANIETDRMRLEQILKNLISNALKFTSHGAVSVDVAMFDEATISFKVTDTGIGISPDKQQLIFEAFQQEDGSTRRKYGGTGLGLSISRELSKLLGGEIQLESKAGEGSVFTLLIPVKPGMTIGKNEPEEIILPQAEIPLIKEQEHRLLSDIIPDGIPDDRAHIHKGDKVILIVDDDTNFAKSLVDYTRKQGYKAITCVRGDEALALAKKYQPAGILLDIQLPVKDGLQVMDELKADPATRHIPVHMMSSHEMKMKSLSKGAIDFISKPVAFEKMNDIFKKLEYVLTNNPQKVLIVEENSKHAKALAYFLETFDVNAEVKTSIADGIKALQQQEVNCVILDMQLPAANAYETLEQVKKTPGMEQLPIIIFTGKSLSISEEQRIKKYADSIVIKTAYSYQRIIDEVSLFLHLVEQNNKPAEPQYKKLGMLNDVLRGKTVLVADDDVRNIFSLTKSLENVEMNVLSAIDGKEALLKLEEDGQKIDVVLMDMMMPEMDGYTSIQEIRKKAAFKSLPIIAVTAKAMSGDREKCIRAGASDYITKPVDIDQLLSLLRVWLYDAGA